MFKIIFTKLINKYPSSSSRIFFTLQMFASTSQHSSPVESIKKKDQTRLSFTHQQANTTNTSLLTVSNQQTKDEQSTHKEIEQSSSHTANIPNRIQGLNKCELELNAIEKNILPLPQSINPQSDELHLLEDLLSTLNAAKIQDAETKKETNELLKQIVKLNLDIKQINKDEMQQMLHKMDEAANSRLTSLAAYATILSLVAAVLIFMYQQNQDQQKAHQIRLQELEKARIKAEALQKSIEKLQSKYSALLIEKRQVEELIQSITNKIFELEQKQVDPAAVHQLRIELDTKKIQLGLIQGKIDRLELYVYQQKSLEEESKKIVTSAQENVEENKIPEETPEIESRESVMRM